MKNRIRTIEVFQVDLPLAEGRYNWSGGNFVEVFDTTIVAIRTDDGLVGYGEVCPLGPAYLPAFAEGARAAIAKIAPELIGVDAAELAVINDRMDRALRGHAYAKSALDMACWDLLGKITALPIVTLLGGRRGETFPLYRAISQESPCEMADKIERYRSEGYTKFQLKVGGVPDVDIDRIETVVRAKRAGEVVIADANTGWTQHDAIRIAHAIRDLDVYLEQPCLSYRECRAVRAHTNRPLILDEVIDSVDTLVEGVAEGAMDVINLKISKVGGLTKARQMRDLAVSLGIALTIEDSWGSDITTAAIVHLAHSTPERYLFSSTDFNSYVTVSTAEGAPQRQAGRMAAPISPGLGISPRPEVLGRPVFVTS